jgi:aminopeptidase N
MFRKTCAVTVILGLALAAAAQRLPHTAVPEHYELTFTPHFENDTFSGDETIDIRVLAPGPSLTLNAAEIQFQKVEITAGGATQTATITPDGAKEQVTLSVPRPLAIGPAKLRISYTGHLNDQMRGLYLSTENGRKYAVSQFEATDARRAYPSFDEPGYKATFDITAVIPKPDMAISNGRVASDVPGPGPDKHTVKFTTTPKMSSYLVALAVGEFKCLEGSSDGIPIRVCGTPEKYQLGRFALEAAQQVMHFYNQYFTIQYPYEKLDFIGVADFSAGAMENTACIISREQLLFADLQRSTPNQLKNIAQEAVAHEMAHQWFGDLVTMQWWNDSWLNEGFASWMSSKPIEQWKPEWNVPQDRVRETSRAMGQDSLRSVHAMMVEVETPAQIIEIFDSIIYEKAAAMLRMVEGYVTPEIFRNGVNAYLKKYAYANATAEDFWNAVAGVSKKPVDRILSSFVVQPGVPLVTVRATCEQGNQHLTLSQRRYTYDRRSFEAGFPGLWAIPVCAKGSSEKCVLLDKREATLTLPGCGALDGNVGARGYYRTAYDPEDFSELAASAESVLSPPERIMFLNDAWAAVRVDRQDIGSFLSLVEALRNDRSRALVQLRDSNLRYIGEYLLTDADQAEYRAWLRGLLHPVMDDVGWNPAPNDSEERRSLRGDLLLTLGAAAHDPRAIAESRAIAQKDLQGQSVDATLVMPALRVVARNGDAALLDSMMARLKSSRSPDDYVRHLIAITDFAEPALIQRLLEFGLSPQVRNQDSLYVYGGLLENPAARKLTWDFIRVHWPQVEAKLTDANIGWLVESMGSFCDPASRDQVRAFFTEHKTAAAERAAQQGIERIEYCIDLKTQQAPKLASWLGREGKMQAGD